MTKKTHTIEDVVRETVAHMTSEERKLLLAANDTVASGRLADHVQIVSVGGDPADAPSEAEAHKVAGEVLLHFISDLLNAGTDRACEAGALDTEATEAAMAASVGENPGGMVAAALAEAQELVKLEGDDLPAAG